MHGSWERRLPACTDLPTCTCKIAYYEIPALWSTFAEVPNTTARCSSRILGAQTSGVVDFQQTLPARPYVILRT